VLGWDWLGLGWVCVSASMGGGWELNTGTRSLAFLVVNGRNLGGIASETGSRCFACISVQSRTSMPHSLPLLFWVSLFDD
jgi:hypothetical protein